MSSFDDYLIPGKRGYLIGIGGVSMSPLAEVLQDEGLVITGSDMQRSEKVSHLESRGIWVNIGHRSENILPEIDFVVRTAAVRDDNPEIQAARALGIPVFERTQAWGSLMKGYKNALCIAGTHGKTTTTSMCTHILMAAEKDPTVMIGGTLPLLNAGHRVGKGDTIVLESCEYYDSFLSFYPTVAVILDIEADHLDYFHDLEAVKASFRKFAQLVPSEGTAIANRDDANTMEALAGIDRSIVTFGLSPEADVQAVNIISRGAKTEFDVLDHGKLFAHLHLQVPGLHNIKNALAAAAAAITLGISATAVTYGLAGFQGANRRFEFKGKYNGADIYDDYAHHPGELKALLDAVEPLGYKRVILVFQPHTFSRTQALFDDFVQQLKRPDLTYLAEIYAAREKNTLGISSEDLAKQIPNSLFFPSFEELETALRWTVAPGDVVLTVGAGDVYKIGEDLVRETAQE
ncbi:MAG: UDP-N-acetylmuramate--L-alanine ligase [Oscillospiraceae bacterium]|nr:UDP-N-acetylmuramate--L-alanine ligase [Oscillospiraceae bacterium]